MSGALRSQAHWIVKAARASELPGADLLDISPRAQAEDAWAAATAAGIAEDALSDAVARWFRLDRADFREADPLATRLLPGTVAREFGVFPLALDDHHLFVATADPCDAEAEQQVGFAAGRVPRLCVASPDAITRAIEASYAPDRAAADMLDRVDPEQEADVSVVVEEEEESAGLDPGVVLGEDEGDAGPIIRLTNMILEDAVKKDASDIHLQPLPTGGVIRLRIDGVLRSGITVPLAVLAQVISRIKVMSRLDISDRMRPQDGRTRVRIGEHRYDLRVSTVPVRSGEKAVIRILDPDKSTELEDSGFPAREVDRLRLALRNRDGIVVVTGPTGSGKTTTMYAALREISTEDVNIMTVEDPVEYELPGLTQIQVDAKKGISFQSALRAILRQDPDVIFVGEIRDDETAEMAAQASLTGHLVLATVHANDAVGSIRRFLDLGLDSGTVSETLRAAVAQRLLRTLCPECARPVGDEPLDVEEEKLADQFGVRPLRRAVGCEACGETGYLGRRPVVEILSPSVELLHLVAERAPHIELTRQARSDGMRTLLEAGLEMVREGTTTLTEMARVIGHEVLEATAGEVDAARAEATTAPEVEEATAEAVAPPAGDQSPPGEAPTKEQLPSTRSERSPEAAGAPSPKARGAPRPTPPKAPRPPDPEALGIAPQVLVVDDDADTRLLVRAILESHGWYVEEASNGKEALLQIGTTRGLSLIVLDLGLPDMDGLEVLRTAKSSFRTAGIPIVVLTGRDDPESERLLLAEGADDYLRKPVSPQAFLTRSKAAIRRHSA